MLAAAGAPHAGAAEPPPGVLGAKAIHLTFDDGPSPRWTPAILDVLSRHRARATFFVLGAQAKAHPGLVRRIAADGHVVANHTYSHVDLTRVDDEHFADEVLQTQAVLRKLTGRDERLLRPPYGAANARVRLLAARLGFRVVLWDIDPRDWRRPGATAIASAVTRAARPGSVVLLHDGGGDRSQTLSALDRVLTTLRGRGYRFEPLGTAAAATAEVAPAAARPLVSFTTRYTPGEPRVVNIRRAAALLDGTVIPPGRRFSLNAALGPRTSARGFVPAPMISGGRFVPSVGGGISQVATALYNVAFLGGLELVAHTPHSFYISRYPMGREATVSWGGPELVFRNDWDTPVVLRLRARSDRLTVHLVSEPLGRRVEAWSGRPHSFVAPTTRVLTTTRLAPGVRRVVQERGGSGFTIEYGRRVFRGASLVRDERFRVRYAAVDRIVEVGAR